MGLSSNIIWHQTDIKGLKNILKSRRFLCSYSLETIDWKNQHSKLAFPMISFCDIPLCDLSEYLKDNKEDKYTGKYGKYTIGLKKAWAQKNGLAPVWYLYKKSKALHELMQHNSKLKAKEWSTFNALIWELLSRVKNFEGSLDKYNFKSYRFYDEKEIRYVPSLETVKKLGKAPILTKEEYDSYKKKNKESALIAQSYISFEISDIEYILISSPQQKKRVIDMLGEAHQNIIIISYRQIIENIIGEGHARRE